MQPACGVRCYQGFSAPPARPRRSSLVAEPPRRLAAPLPPFPLPLCRCRLPQFYPQVSPALVSRFREREESVRGDVFQAYVHLLRQVRPAGSELVATTTVG